MHHFFRFFAALLLFICSCSTSRAQVWTWINGYNNYTSSSPTGTAGVYGTLGVTSPTNFPGSRSGFSSWQDALGNLWVLGGSTCCNGIGNDLWKYNPTGNTWTWMKGSTVGNQYATYGLQGTPSASNNPGGRYVASSWIDNAGRFWVFGGEAYAVSFGSGKSNELWRYNPTTSEWTWMNGYSLLNQNGNYGTIGVSSPFNNPGSRQGGMTWKDSSGDLWLFGGYGYGVSGGLGYLNDLWKYNVSTNEWTWISGSGNINQTGTYGSIGVPSVTNSPGARQEAAVWNDNLGNIWMFGGQGYGTATSMGYLNDLWRYNISSGQWTWMNGTNSINQLGAYGTLAISSSTNAPGSRQGPTSWVDSNGNFWLFGGYGFGASTPSNHLNDFWKYNTISNQWTWMGGSGAIFQLGVYGTLGVPSPTNFPGARGQGRGWTDSAGDLWLFGGGGPSYWGGIAVFNDVWRYQICSVPAVPISISSPSNISICNGNSTTLTVSSAAPVTWYSSLSSTSSIASGTNFLTPTVSTGSYTYYAEANLCSPSASRTAVTFTANPNPSISVNSGSVCYGSTFTIIPSGALSYSYSGGLSLVSPTSTSSYSVTGTSSLGCPSSNTAVSNVLVNPTPTVSIAGSTSICFGSSTTLNANGAISYTWNSSVVSSSIIASPSSNTSYSLTGQNSFGCRHSISTLIAVYPLPTVSVNSGSICAGSVFTIIPSGASSYSYSGGSNTVSPAANSSYSISGISSQGCLSANTVIANVSVLVVPTLTIIGAGSLCIGDTITQTASGSGTSYAWSTGSTNNQITISPTLSTSYSLVVSASNGCTTKQSKTITVNPLPSIWASANNQTLCLGKPLILYGIGALTYTWSGGVLNNVPFVPPASGIYTVTGFDINSCHNTATISTTVNPLPIISAANSPSIVCAGEEAELSAAGATTFIWSTGQSGASVTITPFSTAIYTVTGTDGNGCENTAVILQAVDPCTGLLIKNQNEELHVFPNPNYGEFNIVLSSISETTFIEVFDVSGRLLLKQKITELVSTINMLNFANSIYQVYIKENGLVLHHQKMIKQ
ncbi:MAG: kelch repeat-containing protein [bacterium]|nr:kelch repeat-containing protein [bacterium]